MKLLIPEEITTQIVQLGNSFTSDTCFTEKIFFI